MQFQLYFIWFKRSLILYTVPGGQRLALDFRGRVELVKNIIM